jgi:hypothetical protein
MPFGLSGATDSLLLDSNAPTSTNTVDQSAGDADAGNGLQTFIGQSPANFTLTNAMAAGQAGSQGEQQQGLMQAQNMVYGRGPLAANDTLQAQTQTSMANQSAMANSGSGAAGLGLARRQGAMANAQTQQQAGGQAQTALAQAQLGAMGIQGQTATEARAQDLALVQNQATAIQAQAAIENQQEGIKRGLQQAEEQQTINYGVDAARTAGTAMASDERVKRDAVPQGQGSGLSLARDADLKEPGGDSHFVLREEPNFILVHNARTGELEKMKTEPLTQSERKQALAPHGAGPLQRFADAPLWKNYQTTGGTDQYGFANGYWAPNSTAPAVADQGVSVGGSNSSEQDIYANKLGGQLGDEIASLETSPQSFTLTNAMGEAQAGSAFDQQHALAQQRDAAMGLGPSVANARMRAETNAIMGSQNESASSGAGSSGSNLARRNAMMENQKSLSGIGGTAAGERVKEQVGALQAENQLAGQSRAQDIGLSQDQAQAIQQQEVANTARYAAQKKAAMAQTQIIYGGAQQAAGAAGGLLSAAGGGGDSSAASAAQGNDPSSGSGGGGGSNDSAPADSTGASSYGDVNLTRFDPTHGRRDHDDPVAHGLSWATRQTRHFADAPLDGTDGQEAPEAAEPRHGQVSGERDRKPSFGQRLGKGLAGAAAPPSRAIDLSFLDEAARAPAPVHYSGTETQERLMPRSEGPQQFGDVDHLITQNPYGEDLVSVDDGVLHVSNPYNDQSLPTKAALDYSRNPIQRGAPKAMDPTTAYNGASAHDIWRMRNGLQPEWQPASGTTRPADPNSQTPDLDRELNAMKEEKPYEDVHASEDRRLAELLRHKTATAPTMGQPVYGRRWDNPNTHVIAPETKSARRDRLGEFDWSGSDAKHDWAQPPAMAQADDAPSYGLSYGEQPTFATRRRMAPDYSHMSTADLRRAAGLGGLAQAQR